MHILKRNTAISRSMAMMIQIMIAIIKKTIFLLQSKLELAMEH
jgi:hypothetical protein